MNKNITFHYNDYAPGYNDSEIVLDLFQYEGTEAERLVFTGNIEEVREYLKN